MGSHFPPILFVFQIKFCFFVVKIRTGAYQKNIMKEHTNKPEAQSRTLDSNSKSSRQAPISEILQTFRNNTGMPDNLKNGIEQLSGFSMDDVRVHYNSSKPAQLQALAYAQGTDIHIAPGQEQCLPHEAWHVVQQKQGRVQPTLQLQGMNVNDDDALEREADIMGAEVLQIDSKNQKQLIGSGFSDQLLSNSYVNNLSNVSIQGVWTQYPEDNALYLWDKIENGVVWFYKEGKMWYDIVDYDTISVNHLEWYKYFQKEIKTYKEWCQIFDGKIKSLQTYAAADASKHTTGNYKARNAVISTLTKYELIDACLEEGWDIDNYRYKDNALKYFKDTYNIMTYSTVDDSESIYCFRDYFEQALPIIKGFKQLGYGDPKLIGIKVNRGDSANILDSMDLSKGLNALTDGESYPYVREVKFRGVISTTKGDNPSQNSYARHAAVIWILKIGENHHGFDFHELIKEGYPSEGEITFPMGVRVKIEKVVIHRQEKYANLQPEGCEKAKYTIYGEIF